MICCLNIHAEEVKEEPYLPIIHIAMTIRTGISKLIISNLAVYIKLHRIHGNNIVIHKGGGGERDNWRSTTMYIAIL